MSLSRSIEPIYARYGRVAVLVVEDTAGGEPRIYFASLSLAA